MSETPFLSAMMARRGPRPPIFHTHEQNGDEIRVSAGFHSPPNGVSLTNRRGITHLFDGVSLTRLFRDSLNLKGWGGVRDCVTSFLTDSNWILTQWN